MINTYPRCPIHGRNEVVGCRACYLSETIIPDGAPAAAPDPKEAQIQRTSYIRMMQAGLERLEAERDQLRQRVSDLEQQLITCEEHKASEGRYLGLFKEERDAARAECERLKAPHAKDCAYLLNGKREGRWDCDCDASEVRRLEAERYELRARVMAIEAAAGHSTEHGTDMSPKAENGDTGEKPPNCTHPGRRDVPGWVYCTECQVAWKERP